MELIRDAMPLTDDLAIIEPYQRMALAFVARISALQKPIAEFQKRINELMQTCDEAPLFQNLPGAGEILAPRLMAAFGSQRDRFESAEEIASYCGEAPVTERSGKQKTVKFRRGCPKFLRQTFHEFAWSSAKHCAWARAYYRHKRSQGQGHNTAVRNLAIRWIRILYRCWKTRVAYDEAKYIAALRKRNAPCLEYLVN
jgi:transposase